MTGIHSFKKACSFSKVKIEPWKVVMEQCTVSVIREKGLVDLENINKEKKAIDRSYRNSQVQTDQQKDETNTGQSWA